jgi:hypothetical protein
MKPGDGRPRWRLRMWVGGELKKATFPSKEGAEAARDFLLAKRRVESLGIPGPVFLEAGAAITSVFDAFDLRIVRLGPSYAYRLQVQCVKKVFVRFRGPSAPALEEGPQGVRPMVPCSGEHEGPRPRDQDGDHDLPDSRARRRAPRAEGADGQRPAARAEDSHAEADQAMRRAQSQEVKVGW